MLFYRFVCFLIISLILSDFSSCSLTDAFDSTEVIDSSEFIKDGINAREPRPIECPISQEELEEILDNLKKEEFQRVLQDEYLKEVQRNLFYKRAFYGLLQLYFGWLTLRILDILIFNN